jgi:hypothetical protein
MDALKTWNAKGSTDALPFLKRALELDPKFAMAYTVTGTMYSTLGEGAPGKSAGADSKGSGVSPTQWGQRDGSYLRSRVRATGSGINQDHARAAVGATTKRSPSCAKPRPSTQSCSNPQQLLNFVLRKWKLASFVLQLIALYPLRCSQCPYLGPLGYCSE